MICTVDVTPEVERLGELLPRTLVELAFDWRDAGNVENADWLAQLAWALAAGEEVTLERL